MSVTNASSEPLYLQIQQILIQEIREGRYDADGRLPSERDLTARFGVSRMTARQALQGLLKKGWAYTQVGKGTYVRRLSFHQDLARLTSFSDDMRSQGITPSSKLLRAEIITAEVPIAERLDVPPHTAVVLLQRVRLANRQPVAIETCYLVDAMCPDILRQHDFSQVSLYTVLQNEYGITLAWANQTFRADIATEEECALLKIPSNESAVVLHLQRVTFTPTERPVEYVSSVYRATFYEFQVSLHGVHPKIIATAALEIK